jgi:peptide/nickel transport system permease protein
MLGYIVRRVLASLPVLLVVGIFAFLLLRLAPGDPAAVMAGPEAPADQVAKMREALGVDQPIPVQFVKWMGQTLRGEFGNSYRSGDPVLNLIGRRLEPTLSISILAQLVTVVVAVPLGVLAAWKAGTWVDRSVMLFAVIGFSMPIFWLGFILMTVFGIWSFGLSEPLLPVAGYRSFFEFGFFTYFKYLILPALSLTFVMTALVARVTRSSMIETLEEDYIRTARSKGLSEKVVLVRHALRNASIPIITIIGLQIAVLIAGAVVTESVFAVPGIGRLVVEAISARDFTVIQGVMIVTAGTYVGVNLLVDISYAYLDPRIRY